MDLLNATIATLRDKRKIRNAEREEMETKQEIEQQFRFASIKELKDNRVKCTEGIEKNLKMITGHKHTVRKVVHESEQCTGLTISNMHHRQAKDFFFDAVNLLNDKENINNNKNFKDSIDACKLSTDVQSCALSANDSFKAIKSSVDKAETLFHNVQIITEANSDKDQGLETSLILE